MRKIVAVLLTAVAFMASCSTVDCPLNNVVYLKLSLNDGSGKFNDTLSIRTRRSDGTDTLLLNRLTNVGSAWLRVSYTQDRDIYFLTRTDTQLRSINDTLVVEKRDMPHFESVECAPIYFHEITGLSCTHHSIDSVVLSNPRVDYDTTRTNITLHFKVLD